MAISNTTNRAEFTGNNSTTVPYVISFRFDDPAWLSVYRVDAAGNQFLLAAGTGYTLTGSSLYTMSAVPPSEKLRVLRWAPMLQTVDTHPAAGSYAAALEQQLDQMTMAMQDGIREIGTEEVHDLLDQAAAAMAIATPAAASAGAAAASAATSASTASGAASAASVSAGVATFAASNVMLQGAFASAAEAEAAGVKLGGSYFDLSYQVKAVAFPLGSNVALMGDSQTWQNAYQYTVLQAQGYGAWMRLFLDSRIDFLRGPDNLTFATNGFTTDQIIATHLPQVMASGARACFFMTGSNDGGTTPSAYATKITYICNQLRSVGCMPICLEPPPIPLSRPGNEAGGMSASMAALWAAIGPAVAAGGGLHVKCPGVMETTPRSAIAKDAYLRDDHVHLNDDGACAYGKAAAAVVKTRFSFSLDPYNMGGTWVGNPTMAGSGGTPSGWQPVTTQLSSGSSASSTLVDIGGGNYAWEITHTDGGSGSGSLIINYGVANNVVTGQTLDAIMTLEVITGGIGISQLTCNMLSPQLQLAKDLNFTVNPPVTRITAADGPVIIRTPKGVVTSPQNAAGIVFSVSGTSKFRISRCAVRSFAS